MVPEQSPILALVPVQGVEDMVDGALDVCAALANVQRLRLYFFSSEIVDDDSGLDIAELALGLRHGVVDVVAALGCFHRNLDFPAAPVGDEELPLFVVLEIKVPFTALYVAQVPVERCLLRALFNERQVFRRVVGTVRPGILDEMPSTCSVLSMPGWKKVGVRAGALHGRPGAKWQIWHLENKKSRRAFLETPGHRIRLVFTPKHCPWLNPIENWFAKLQRHVVTNGNFASVNELVTKIDAYISYYN